MLLLIAHRSIILCTFTFFFSPPLFIPLWGQEQKLYWKGDNCQDHVFLPAPPCYHACFSPVPWHPPIPSLSRYFRNNRKRILLFVAASYTFWNDHHSASLRSLHAVSPTWPLFWAVILTFSLPFSCLRHPCGKAILKEQNQSFGKSFLSHS